MSDAIVDEAMARDSRFAALGLAIALETDLRENDTIKVIMAAVRADADTAMDDLADMSPADTVGIAAALVKVRTLVYIRRTISTILNRGNAAEQSIRAQDEAERLE